MSPNFARLTSVESTAGRAGSRSGKGTRLDDGIMAVTRKLNRGDRFTVTGHGSQVNGPSSPGVMHYAGYSDSTRADSGRTLQHPPLWLEGRTQLPQSSTLVRNSSFAPAWRACVVVGLSAVSAASAAAQSKRPMTFLDVQNMRQVGTPDLSTDGRWLL